MTLQRFGFVVLSMTTSAPVVVLCEEDKNSLANALLARNKDGSIDYGKSFGNISNPSTWDKVGNIAGTSLQGAIDSGIPTQLSYGFISGYCSGLALKKVGKAVATVFGLGFVCLQTLSYYGYVTVDHKRIEQQVESALDLNQDGVVDQEDAKLAFQKVTSVLEFGMPSGGGFVAGFVGGLRSG